MKLKILYFTRSQVLTAQERLEISLIPNVQVRSARLAEQCAFEVDATAVGGDVPPAYRHLPHYREAVEALRKDLEALQKLELSETDNSTPETGQSPFAN